MPKYNFFCQALGKPSRLHSSPRVIRQVSATPPVIVSDQMVVRSGYSATSVRQMISWQQPSLPTSGRIIQGHKP